MRSKIMYNKKFFFVSIISLISFSTLMSCEELISKSFDTDTVKKLRAENTALKIQVDKIQKLAKGSKDELITKNLIISLYDLRHGVEKFALENNGNYPLAENLFDLEKLVQTNLPKEFTIESDYLETIKSTQKGYIFIANINNKKIVVSNLI